jgi:hypothetical protein
MRSANNRKEKKERATIHARHTKLRETPTWFGVASWIVVRSLRSRILIFLRLRYGGVVKRGVIRVAALTRRVEG